MPLLVFSLARSFTLYLSHIRSSPALCFLSSCQVRRAPDGHFKFHAACVVNICIQQLAEWWRQYTSALSKAVTATAATAAAVPATAATAGGDTPMREAGGAGGADGAGGTVSQPGTGGTMQWGEVTPPQLGEAGCDLVMALVWSNMDEPLAQTLRQVQGVFDALLDVLSSQQQAAGLSQQLASQRGGAVTAITAGSSGHAAQHAAFLERVARALLGVAYTRKARYGRLAALVPRMGARALLDLHPPLIRESLLAMQDDMVSNSAATFLKVLLETLRAECRAAADPRTMAKPGRTYCSSTVAVQGVNGTDGEAVRAEAVRGAWQSWWLQDLMDALTSRGCGSETNCGGV